MAKVDSIIAALTTMSRADVEAHWARVGAGALPRLPDPLMRRLTAQLLQERRYGGFPAIIRRELERVSEEPGGQARTSRPPMPSMRLSDCTRLIREWNGRTIEVLVRDGAYEWEGRIYRSLSQIAREVTGAHWSGPRFFAMRPRRG